jgi:superfamily I DNA/RNA helicase
METTIFGPPGTGKTTRLIEIVKQELENGTLPERIAFVSFSRKAAEEARDRAANKLGMDANQMVWFRTLHSMAFQTLGLTTKRVLRGRDFFEIGKLLGLTFSSNASLDIADGALFTPGNGGDAYLSMLQMARVTGRTLEEQFQKSADRQLHFQQLKLVDQVIRDYKREMHKVDFVDMIENFIDEGNCPQLDVLIVDEAQDLVPMQWRMVHQVLKPRAKRVYFAGDDDQCIYSWMGVNVSDFLAASDNKIILDKSYRLPISVHSMADSLVKQLHTRQQKVWRPTEETGTVVWHRDILDVDLTTGEWLILARTNFIANKIATTLKEQGFLYWREGSGWSISPNVLTGIEVWLKLCKGLLLSAPELKKISTLLTSSVITKAGRKKLAYLDPEVEYTFKDIREQCELSATPDMPWHQVLKVSENERIYIASVRRMGESILTGKPRIKISTIHKAKGGEADNVALLLDSSRACAENEDQDSEIRTFYVGLTRAKKSLHLIEPQTQYGFQL